MKRSARWLRFISTLSIRTPELELLRLHYNEAQRRVWERVAEKIDKKQPVRLIILKARREGISTAIESWGITLVASMDRVNALITAHEKDPAHEIFKMAKTFVETSPLLAAVSTIGKNTITIGNSQMTVATAGSPDAQRGKDLTFWHASEAASYRFPEVIEATMQCLPRKPGTFSIGVIESTAKGQVGDGEDFYNEWLRAEAGESDWVPIFLPFHIFKDYTIPGVEIDKPTPEEFALRERFELTDGQLAWRRHTIRNDCKGDINLFRQEYPSTAEEAFIQSGNPFFDPNQLLPMERNLKNGVRGNVETDGSISRRSDGHLEIFKFPEPGHTYVVGADSSMGMPDVEGRKQHSRSGAEVLDMDTLEQVAEYDAVSAPHIFAKHLVGIGRLYNNALLAPEVQSSGGGGGREVLVYIRDMGYWNLHQWKGDPDRIRRQDSILYGWETNSKTRPRMLARIREVVMEGSAIIRSRRLYKQLSAFGESDSGHAEALAGRDDLLFAWGIALMSRSENYFKPVVQPTYNSNLEPNWESMGIHVKHQEDLGSRLRRLMTQPAPDDEKRSFLEL